MTPPTPEMLEEQYYDGLEIEEMEAAVAEWKADRLRLAEAEKMAAYGTMRLMQEYEIEAGVEGLMASVIYHVPSDHRTFEAFVADKLAALAHDKEQP